MFADFEANADTFNFAALALSFLLSLFFSLFIDVLAEIHDADDGRISFGGDHNEIKFVFEGTLAGVFDRDDAELLAVRTNQPHFGKADFIVGRGSFGLGLGTGAIAPAATGHTKMILIKTRAVGANGGILAVFVNLCNSRRAMKSLAYNRRATFDYDILETFEGGLVLLGTEVKSVRAGNVSLKGAFVTIHEGRAQLTNATIPPWQMANAPEGYDPTRSRTVLLKKAELERLVGASQAQGLTIVPIKVYNKGSRIKLELGLARGKRKYQKKERKREQDIKREVDRVLRGKE